jgi:glycosyltransferase involved in cell wall biosynthesis
MLGDQAQTRSVKLAILTNTVAPYRLPLYEKLAEHCEVTVFHGGAEPNRWMWQTDSSVGKYRIRRSWGFQIRVAKRRNGQRIDRRCIHFTPGLLGDLLRLKPDRIVSTEMGFRSLLALGYGLAFGIPVWIWWGGTCHTEQSIGVIRHLVRRGLFRYWVRRWISYGKSSTEYLRWLGIPPDSILQIQNCVDDHLFSSNGPKLFHLVPRPVLLHVGQLIARKGIAHLLRAAAALQGEGYVFSLLLVGSGPEEARLRELADELGLSNVHFHAAVGPEAMPAVYRSGDFLIFPTVEDVWGLVVNEAILSGLPVLCSKYAGCARELIPAEAIFDPTDPREFLSVVREALRAGGPPKDSSRVLSTAAVAERLVQAIAH